LLRAWSRIKARSSELWLSAAPEIFLFSLGPDAEGRRYQAVFT
jgi:hypothetical protein